MDLDVPMIAVKLLTGLVIGASIGLTGIGGGVLVLPTLTLLFGLPPTVAVGTANLYSFLCKLSATYFHYKQKTIAFGTSGCFLIGAIPACIHRPHLVRGIAPGRRGRLAGVPGESSSFHCVDRDRFRFADIVESGFKAWFPGTRAQDGGDGSEIEKV